jgi:hypothetical protein
MWKFLYKISKQTISAIVPEVCESIIEALKVYVKIDVFSCIF